MQPYPGAMQPKKGTSALTIVLIVLGVLVLLGVGTCTAGYFWVRREVSQMVDGGSVVMVSPPDVVSDLSGPKKDYVGSWHGAHGGSLDIAPNGHMIYRKDRGGEKLEAPIAAFKGDDMEVRVFVVILVKVQSPPKLVGDHWEMKVDGATYERR